MPTASAKEFGFRFDLRTRGGKEAAVIFGQLASAMAKLSTASVGTRNSIGNIRNSMATLSTAVVGLNSKFDQLAKKIQTSTGPNQTANIYRMAASLGAMGYVANRVGDGIIGTFTRAGKTLFEIGTSFEYIKAGLDFAFGYRSQEMMTKAMNVAQETNVSTREVLDVTRSLGVLKINPFSDMLTKKGQIQSSLQSLADLAALVPQQGMEGALFAIRNALSGQWRSLQMRFDIPLNMINEIRAKITETMTTQQRFDAIMQGITDNFGGMMKGVSHTTKFYVDNIKDVVTNLAYDVFQKASKVTNPFFEKVFNYFKDLRNNKQAIEKLSQAFISMTSAVMSVAGWMFTVVKYIMAFAVAHPQITKTVAAMVLLFGITSKLVGIIGFVGSSLMFAAQGTQVFAAGMFRANVATQTFAMTWRGLQWTSGITLAIAAIGILIGKIWEAYDAKRKYDAYAGKTLTSEDYLSAAVEGQAVSDKLFRATPEAHFNGSAVSIDPAAYNKSLQEAYAVYQNQASSLTAAQRTKIKDAFKLAGGTPKGEDEIDLSNAANNTGATSGAALMRNFSNLSREISSLGASATNRVQWGEMRADLDRGFNVSGNTYLSMYGELKAKRQRSIESIAKISTPGTDVNAMLAAYRSGGDMSAFIGKDGAGRKLNVANYEPLMSLYGGALGQETPADTDVRALLSDSGRVGNYEDARTAVMRRAPFEGGFAGLISKAQEAGFGKDAFGKPIGGQYISPSVLSKIEQNPMGEEAQITLKHLLDLNNIDKGNTDVFRDMANFLKSLGVKVDKTNDLNEDIADNTKKTEEMLPPLFREIFDDFTRRSVKSEMGANSLYSRLAMAR